MSKTPMHVQLVSDPNVPREVKEWLRDFTLLMLQAQSMTSPPRAADVLNRLVSMDVDVPGHCDCERILDREKVLDASLWQWMHANHQRYNRAVWELIAGEYLPQLVVALTLDFSGPDEMKGGQAFGKIMAKAESNRLLRHFVREDPDPEWVGQE